MRCHASRACVLYRARTCEVRTKGSSRGKNPSPRSKYSSREEDRRVESGWLDVSRILFLLPSPFPPVPRRSLHPRRANPSVCCRLRRFLISALFAPPSRRIVNTRQIFTDGLSPSNFAYASSAGVRLLAVAAEELGTLSKARPPSPSGSRSSVSSFSLFTLVPPRYSWGRGNLAGGGPPVFAFERGFQSTRCGLDGLLPYCA